MDTVLEFHVEAPQATAGEGLAQGPYVVAVIISNKVNQKKERIRGISQ